MVNLRYLLLLSTILINGCCCIWQQSSDSSEEEEDQTWPRAINKHPYQWMNPVNIVSSFVTVMELDILSLSINFNLQDNNLNLVNTGRGIEVTLVPGTYNVPSITGGVLFDNTYIFHKMDIYWGSDNQGSLHQINGYSYAIEIIVVFWKEEYGSYDSAQNQVDGIVILSYFGEISAYENRKISSLLEQVRKVTQPGTNIEVSFSNEFVFLEAVTKGSYFAMPGSLPFPPFTPSATWIILTETFQISEEQLDILRTLIAEDGSPMISLEIPPINPSNDRPIVKPTEENAVEISRSLIDSFVGLFPNYT